MTKLLDKILTAYFHHICRPFGRIKTAMYCKTCGKQLVKREVEMNGSKALMQLVCRDFDINDRHDMYEWWERR